MLYLDIHYDDVDNKDHFLTLYRPAPATEYLPEWFKNLKSKTDKGITAKSCRGLYDMMTMGYMIIWTFDVTISKDVDGRLSVRKTRDNSTSDFHSHPHFQLGLYPDANLSRQLTGVEKVTLPYRIKTSKNTSVFLVQPSYHPDLKTEIMPGIIDSDKFYSPLNVLFTIKNFPNDGELQISAGTPLAQLIPFKREKWKIRYGKVDKELLHTIDSNIGNINRYYQKFLWSRKTYNKETE
jgi:hypothetical protein